MSGSQEVNPERIHQFAAAFGGRGLAAERRLVSLSTALELPLVLKPQPYSRQRTIRLDPGDEQIAWVDPAFGVA